MTRSSCEQPRAPLATMQSGEPDRKDVFDIATAEYLLQLVVPSTYKVGRIYASIMRAMPKMQVGVQTNSRGQTDGSLLASQNTLIAPAMKILWDFSGPCLSHLAPIMLLLTSIYPRALMTPADF